MVNNIICYRIWSLILNKTYAYVRDNSKNKLGEVKIYQTKRMIKLNFKYLYILFLSLLETLCFQHYYERDAFSFFEE